jgi:urate oxidase
MGAKIVSNRYGKTRVRMVKVLRQGERHELRDITAHISLEGDFVSSYTQADNSKVLPTDTMKNTVYALGKHHPLDTIESFALHLGRHFVGTVPHVSSATVRIEQTGWGRISVAGREHEHSFIRGSNEKPMCQVVVGREGASVESGIDDLVILKTTDSGFSGFMRDAFTTLKETGDRIMGTSVAARWNYSVADSNFARERAAVRTALLECFAGHKSESVQHTLYAMGEAALNAAKGVRRISLTMPNRHCLLVDLTPFGMKNHNEIFLPIDEPSGLIEATLERA